MESAQRELLCVLLRKLCSLGLIDERTCLGAEDLVHSGMDIPELFRDPMCPAGGGDQDGCSEHTE